MAWIRKVIVGGCWEFSVIIPLCSTIWMCVTASEQLKEDFIEMVPNMCLLDFDEAPVHEQV